MRTQEQEAGPERDEHVPRQLGVEAAGPAGPRLVMREVKVQVGVDSLEARVSLLAGAHSFTGAAAGRGRAEDAWQLAAAATVTAMQHYLQQCAAHLSPPQIHLEDIAAVTTGIGHEVINATVRLAHGNAQTHLLGSALVRNDRCSTAVAAALDAAARRLGLFHLLGDAAQPPPVSISADDQPGPDGDESQGVLAATALPAASAHSSSAAVATTSATSAAAMGIEITPTSVRAAAVDGSGQIIAEARQPSRPSSESDTTVEMALEAARAVVESLDSSAERVCALGLAAPGRLRPTDGVCVSCGDFPSWREVQLAGPFTDEFDLPVRLIGSTQAAALAEARYGAARDLSRVIFVRVGLDIDVAVILDARPIPVGEAAFGHAGHMVIAPGEARCACGESGCWQALAGREALVSRVVKDIGSGVPSALPAAVDNRLGALTPALICRMAAGGDAVARKALEETGRYLALGLSNLVALFDPEAIILEGAPSNVGAALRHAAESALKRSPRPEILSRCVLLAPALGDSAPVLGAAIWAWDGAP